MKGTVSIIDIPPDNELEKMTRQVTANNSKKKKPHNFLRPGRTTGSAIQRTERIADKAHSFHIQGEPDL
jgi:hypothetical protein